MLPTDTVYGLCGDPHSEAAARELYRLKQRPAEQPLALLAKDVEALLELVPELPRAPLEALLPGAVHAGAAEPRAALPLADGLGAGDDRRARPEAGRARRPRCSSRSRAVVATSANLHGGPEARTLEDVPAEIRAGAGAVVDGGELPGTPSTVLDLTGDEPRVLREGAVSAREALERAAAAFGR